MSIAASLFRSRDESGYRVGELNQGICRRRAIDVVVEPEHCRSPRSCMAKSRAGADVAAALVDSHPH